MKRLGSVLHSLDNLLIVRADKTLDANVLTSNIAVFTKKMKRIGKIKEVFGPVKAPYISVRISKEFTSSEIANLKRERVYLK